jgi:hypothetical protein
MQPRIMTLGELNGVRERIHQYLIVSMNSYEYPQGMAEKVFYRWRISVGMCRIQPVDVSVRTGEDQNEGRLKFSGQRPDCRRRPLTWHRNPRISVPIGFTCPLNSGIRPSPCRSCVMRFSGVSRGSMGCSTTLTVCKFHSRARSTDFLCFRPQVSLGRQQSASAFGLRLTARPATSRGPDQVSV